MSAPLKSWTPWLREREREYLPLDRRTREAAEGMWREEWKREIIDAANRREEIPLTVARSFARQMRGSVLGLRYASNYEQLAFALRDKAVNP